MKYEDSLKYLDQLKEYTQNISSVRQNNQETTMVKLEENEDVCIDNLNTMTENEGISRYFMILIFRCTTNLKANIKSFKILHLLGTK